MMLLCGLLADRHVKAHMHIALRTVTGDSCGGVVCFRLDVAIEFAPVSPRGSPPKLEPRRRCFGFMLWEFDLRPVVEDIAETVSVCAEDDIAVKE